MKFFRRKPTVGGKGDTLGHLLVPVAVHESINLQKAWRCECADEAQVSLFAELVILYLSIADRLAYRKYGPLLREEFMTPAVAVAMAAFARQSCFGDTPDDRKRFFHRMLMERFEQYSKYPGIMARDMDDQLLFNAAIHLVSSSLDEEPDSSSYWRVVGDTGQVLIESMVTLLTTPSFKALTE